ncbi:hypothetical protein T484DRAFT_1740368 [Baffinella frigidus]|nr:hypothetical protein T484DRAFT_1740368 [Cryptophyta sp. CCMP2293]
MAAAWLSALVEKAKGVAHDMAAHTKTEKVNCCFTRDDNPLGLRITLVEIVSDTAHFVPAYGGWDSWNSALEGISAKFTVDWTRENKYSRQDLRVLRLGESIFSILKSRGLNPEWNGERVGDMTITAVDEAGVNLALAMALHPRLGAESRLSLVSSLHPTSPLSCSASLRLSLP